MQEYATGHGSCDFKTARRHAYSTRNTFVEMDIRYERHSQWFIIERTLRRRRIAHSTTVACIVRKGADTHTRLDNTLRCAARPDRINNYGRRT